jgi:WD40 repeat protein
VRFWDLKDNRWVGPELHPDGAVNALAYRYDGATLAAAERGAEVSLWDVPSGRKIHTFRGHRRAVGTVAFHPEGRLLATGGEDGDVRLWDVGRAVAADGGDRHGGR